ncbi:hypothetical protein [Streptomyces sp. NRRL F-5065]|uniref:hypothetical protein n=1 Tax=Streptomyces sp. NRRL F-5065 TaxID=1463855 RepID=UPI0004C12721|nr:hypothetical protein [Streptomyces sp. NRRL F-5065]
MDPNGLTAQRFPLIARFRPACLPLRQRVRALVELADTAVTTADQGLASSVYNQAGLLASDLGLPGLAREMCHQHAAAYLHRCPLPAMCVIRGLEPVVNLARLQIRAGRADCGRQRLLDLYQAVEEGRAAQFEGIEVPAGLTRTDEDRREVHAWLWRVLLADGTRALTTEGRWAKALEHVQTHRGVGRRMLDGRQVAVLASLVAGDPSGASTLLADTVPGAPWEQAVTACLTVLCHRDGGQPVDDHLTDLVTGFRDREPEPGMTLFGIRLGHTILDMVGSTAPPTALRVVTDLHHRAMAAEDGYAARENLKNPLFTAYATDRHVQECRTLLRACALGTGAITDELREELKAALHASDRVIHESLTRPPDPGHPAAGQMA